MTPISFALEILLDCETIEKAHRAARKYIKELEKAQAPVSAPTLTPRMAQAPSTQRILNEMMAEGGAGIPPPPPPKAIMGGMIDNGDGTKSKRKW